MRDTNMTTMLASHETSSTATLDAPPAVAKKPAAAPGTATLTPAGGPLEPQEGPAEVFFTEGLIGIPEAKRYMFETGEEIEPLLRMRCVDRPGLAFLVVDPNVLVAGYAPRFSAETLAAIGLREGEAGLVRAIVNISPIVEECSANLLAPIVINPKTMRGAQVILDPPAYSVRHPLA
jgi:flagellar assembly factor FliW